MSAFTFKKLVIAGVGLIGGSLALALRRAGQRGEIVGVGRSRASLERAVTLQVIDRGVASDDAAALAEALRGADLILLAAPVAQTGPLLSSIAPYLEPHAVITDAGSTKADVIAAAHAALGAKIAQFVPGHPIAGREASGVEAALADLFTARNVVLCPLPGNAAPAVARIDAMWRAAGARLHHMGAAQHDTVLAAVSHLPHVLAFAMIEQILDAPDAAVKFSFAGGGFRDFTRIAASSPEMWRDICLANRGALLGEIDAYAAVLARLRAAIEAGDGATLESVFERARAARSAWGAKHAAAADAGSKP